MVSMLISSAEDLWFESGWVKPSKPKTIKFIFAATSLGTQHYRVEEILIGSERRMLFQLALL